MAEGGEGQGPDKEEPEFDLEQQLKELEQEKNEIAQKMQENVAQELSSHLAKLEEEFRTAFDDRIKMVTSQAKTQASEEMSKKQTDILRTNKVFREISRPLNEKWKPVFNILISDLTPEQRRVELEKVEHEKAFMQSYKALMTWKEVRGEAFDIRELLPALRTVGLDDLAQKMLNILDSDKDSLLTIADGTKPKASGPAAAGSAAKTSTLSSASASGDTSAQSKSNVNAEEILDDRHLLQIAKKLGSEWEPLAKGLSIPGAEIAEILEGEGKTYQGGFKMLWNWRESKTNLTEGLDALIAQLKALNRRDVVELLH